MLVSVESSDKLDNCTLSIDGTEVLNRGVLDQVLYRTTANEPLRVVQQPQGQRGSKHGTRL